MRTRVPRPLLRSLAASLAWVPFAARADLPVLEIATSIYPLELIAREIGGEGVRVTTLVPPGASPHTFEPLPGDVVRLARARLFLRVGAGFDDWCETLAAAAGPALESVALLDLPDLAPGAPGEAGDPHAWLDPLWVRDALAPLIARRMAEVDPAGAAGYEARRRAFSERLTRLDRDIRSELEAAPGRAYVAFHAAWRHFARRYDLVEVGVVSAFPGDEATGRELAALVVAARAAGVAGILVEPQLDPRVASAIAAEFGGSTVLVDPLGDPDDPARASYEGLMRFNARAFAGALARGKT